MHLARTIKWSGITLLLGVFGGDVFAQNGTSFDLSWYTIDGGGFELSGTAGQFDAGTSAMTGGKYALTGGFWAAAQPATTAGVPTLSEWGVIGLMLVVTVAGVIVIRRRRTVPA